MKNNKHDFFQNLDKELAISGFKLEKFTKNSFSETNLKILETELIKKISGGRHEKTNADGSKETTFIKAGPVIY